MKLPVNPMYFQKDCKSDVTARYTVNEYGNVAVDNRCVDQNGQELRSLGEAFISNEPFNSKFKVSFIPEAVRWMPVGRGDYWILKLIHTIKWLWSENLNENICGYCLEILIQMKQR